MDKAFVRVSNLDGAGVVKRDLLGDVAPFVGVLLPDGESCSARSGVVI